ncbi:hypothetical protein BH10ACT2_BH10ACT2_01420 [soil metagenome]
MLTGLSDTNASYTQNNFVRPPFTHKLCTVRIDTTAAQPVE